MKSFFYKIIFTYLFILLFSISLIFLLAFFIIEKRIEKEIEERIVQITKALKLSFIRLVYEENNLQERLKKIGKDLNLRITLISMDGTVLADSHKGHTKMENQKQREEVQAAIFGEPKIFKRYSQTFGKNMYHYAFLMDGEKEKTILRISFFTETFSGIYADIFYKSFIVVCIVLIISLFFAYLISYNFSRGLNEIYIFLLNLSKGNFEKRIYLKKPRELKELTKILNQTAEELQNLFYLEKKEKEEVQIFFENLKEGILILDKRGMVLNANKAFLEFFPHPLTGETYYWNLFTDLSLLEFLESHIKEKVNLKEEIKIDKKYFLITAKYIGDLEESLILFYDITYYKEMTRVKKEIVENISHEIKTPLTVIGGYLEMVEEELKGDEKIEKIRGQVEKLKKLTEEMLKLSSIEEAKGVIKLEKVDLIKILKKTLENYKSLIEGKGVALKLEILNTYGEILGYEPFLEKLFSNLLDNAYKFTDRGEIRVKVYEEEGFLKVEISDTGIGIKERDLIHIFERFFVGEEGRTKERSGFGLGLSISKHIMEVHKGKIEVISDYGKGTNFILYFPKTQKRVELL